MQVFLGFLHFLSPGFAAAMALCGSLGQAVGMGLGHRGSLASSAGGEDKAMGWLSEELESPGMAMIL